MKSSCTPGIGKGLLAHAFGTLVWLLGAIGQADGLQADLLYLRNDQPPLVGRIMGEEKLQVIFREQFLSGESREKKIFKADIRIQIRTIDDRRLESLTPTRPREYFEYGEELRRFSQDFVARKLALRLFLLGARHGDSELRKSCLLAMLAFELEPAQKRRIRALALLSLEPRYHQPFQDSGAQPVINARGKQKLLGLTRLMLQGELSTAAEMLRDAEVRNTVGAYADLISWQELLEMTLDRQLDLAAIGSLIELELRLTGQPAAKRGSEKRTEWAPTATTKPTVRLDWVSFENLTDFDPSRSLYRDGEWQRTGASK